MIFFRRFFNYIIYLLFHDSDLVEHLSIKCGLSVLLVIESNGDFGDISINLIFGDRVESQKTMRKRRRSNIHVTVVLVDADCPDFSGGCLVLSVESKEWLED